MDMERRYFTTHEAGQLLGVSLPTVINWIKAGRLSAHRTPGGHRRIERDTLVAFIRRHGLPMPPELLEESSAPRVLVLMGSKGDLEPILELVRRAGLRAMGAKGMLSIGFALGQAAPDAVILDLASLGARAMSIFAELSAIHGYRPPPLFALGDTSDERLRKRVTEAGFFELIDPGAEPVFLRQRLDWALVGR